MRSRLLVGVVAVLVGFGVYRWMSGGHPTATSSNAPEKHAAQNDSSQAQTAPEAPSRATASTATASPVNQPTTAAAPAAAPVSTPSQATAVKTPAALAHTAPTQATAPAPAPTPTPTVSPIADGCHSMTFSHQNAEGHEDGEACLYHKNLIKLVGVAGEINPKTVCVRVNGRPAKFKFVPAKPEAQVLLGSIAGPTTKILVTFCTGKMTCAADCTVPKDDFMEAIGGAETDEDLFTDRASKVGWKKGKNPQKEEETLRRELAELKKNLKDELKKGSLFEGWELGNTAPASCGRAHAAQR